MSWKSLKKNDFSFFSLLHSVFQDAENSGLCWNILYKSKRRKDQRELKYQSGILKDFMGGDYFQTLDHVLFSFVWPVWWGKIKGVLFYPSLPSSIHNGNSFVKRLLIFWCLVDGYSFSPFFQHIIQKNWLFYLHQLGKYMRQLDLSIAVVTIDLE